MYLIPLILSLVRDHIPLEQGLRQSSQSLKLNETNVRDHIPLEQGLRRLSKPPPPSPSSRQRPYSIRTRIKTIQVDPYL